MLTILLPIAGRPEFVARFMGIALPFPVVKLEGPGFLDKIAKGIDAVETPYAMLCDCDDFPVADGIARCVEFLEQHPDFVCCSGRLKGVWLFPDKVRGPLRMWSRQYSPYDTPAVYDQDGVNERVLAGFANSWSYYGVYRTDALKTIWREVEEFSFTDLMVHEKFCAMRCLTLGKAASFADFTHLVRQYGTSQVAATRSDWLKTHCHDEVVAVMRRMRQLGVDVPALNKLWGTWYGERYRTFYGHPWRKRLGRMFPALRRLSPLLEICR